MIAAAAWAPASPPIPVGLLIVYRRRNASLVRRALATARRNQWHVRLWALDQPDAALAEHTVGSGPGSRLELLNRLHESLPPGIVTCVLADDDVLFVSGGLDRLVTVAGLSGFALAQPAHVVDSNYSHGLTRFEPFSIARRTTFVEVGPVVVVGESGASRVFPLPVEYGMGWGLDVEWSFALEDAVLGIVDAALVRHITPVAGQYSGTEEWRRVEAALHRHGVSSLLEIQQTIATWRVGRRRPPWL